MTRAWSTKDNIRSFEEGWGLFNCDSGILRILRLDDRMAGRPFSCRCLDKGDLRVACKECQAVGFKTAPALCDRFESDADAVDYVMEMAARGSRWHKQMIERAAGIPVPYKQKSRRKKRE